MSATKRKYLNAGEYLQIKKLLEMDFKPKQIKQITGRSTATIDRVKNTSDYVEYKKLLKTLAVKRNSFKPTIVSVPKVQNEQGLLIEIRDLLVTVSSKLSVISTNTQPLSMAKRSRILKKVL